MSRLLIIGALAAVLATPATAATTRCRGANGKFVACARAAAPAAPRRCRGANGKFVSCTAPGARPA